MRWLACLFLGHEYRADWRLEPTTQIEVRNAQLHRVKAVLPVPVYRCRRCGREVKR